MAILTHIRSLLNKNYKIKKHGHNGEEKKSATATHARRGSCVDIGSVSASIKGDYYFSRFSHTQ